MNNYFIGGIMEIVRRIDMPNKIIVLDIIDEMLDNIDYIGLNTHIRLSKEDR